MQSAKKTKRILSAISMAAAAAMSAHAAHGMTLTTFYGDDPSYANSNNAIIVGTGYTPSASAPGSADAVGGLKYFSSATPVAAGVPSVAGGIVSTIGSNLVQTITIPVGDYLSLAIDALLTGNVNADAGVNSGTGTKAATHQVQPSFLGLSQLDVNIPSSNATGNILSPITASANPNIGAPQAGYTGTVYFTTAGLNTSKAEPSTTAEVPQLGANGGTAGGAYNIVPAWGSVHISGGIEPNNAPGGWNAAGPGLHASNDSGTHASGNLGIKGK